jgi:hypothetical protein
MSDYNSSLPVRTEADADERLQSKIVDFIDPTKGAEVDSDKNLHVEMHGNDSAGVDKVVKLSESGNIALDGDYDLSNNSNPSSSAVIAHDRGASVDETSQNKRPTALAGDNNKVALDVAISDSNGNSFTESNPLFVAQVNSPGLEICEYHSIADVASGASVTQTYTVAGTALELSQVEASASGKMKIEIKVGATGAEVTKAVLFNSTANPNMSFQLKDVITVAVGDNVLVVKTNKDNQPQDLYSSVIGKLRA